MRDRIGPSGVKTPASATALGAGKECVHVAVGRSNDLRPAGQPICGARDLVTGPISPAGPWAQLLRRDPRERIGDQQALWGRWTSR